MQGAVLCCAGVVPGCRRGGCTPCARSKNMDEKMRMCVKGLQDHVRGKELPKISFGVQKFPVQPMTCKTTKGSKAASQRSRDGGQGRACWEHWGVALLSPLCTAWHVVSFRSKITASFPHYGTHPHWAGAAGPTGFSWKSRRGALPLPCFQSCISQSPPDPTALPTQGWEARSRSGSVSSPNPPSITTEDLAQLSHHSTPAGFALTAPSLWV